MIFRNLPELLPELDLVDRRYVMERLKTNEDLVELAENRAGIKPHAKIPRVSQHMRTRFRCRTEMIRGKGETILLAFETGAATKIGGTAGEYAANGLNLEGLRAKHNNDFGYIAKATDTDVHVETEFGPASWPSAQTSLTPSIDTISRIRELSYNRGDLEKLKSAVAALIADRNSGRASVDRNNNIGNWLRAQRTIKLTNEISFTFGDNIRMPKRSQRGPVSVLPAIEYCFSRDRTAIETLPAVGLAKHGPADGETFDKKEPSILVLYPQGARQTAETTIQQLLKGLPDSRAHNQGFAATYRLSRINSRFLAANSDGDQTNPGAAYVKALADAYDPAQKTDAADRYHVSHCDVLLLGVG